MEPLELVSNLLNLGWPGIVMWAIYVVWKQYQKRSDELVANLQEELLSAKQVNEKLMSILLDNAKMRFDSQRAQAATDYEARALREGDTAKVTTRALVAD